MPELPEVETVKNELAPHVVGKKVTAVELLWEGMVFTPSAREFRAQLVGQKITGLSRRGKYLIFQLAGGKALVIHLRMTGSLLLKPAAKELAKFVRAVIFLDKDLAIQFRDIRKFGRLWLVDDACEAHGELGPEPLEAGFTVKMFFDILHNRSAPVKSLLLDQALIAGIGNMYADEALFHARIHPAKAANSLSPAEVKRLYLAIREVLNKGIKNKGASVDTYFRPDGTQGTAHTEFCVAHQKGKSCPVCGTPIARTTVRQRGTYFCPKCQP